MAIVNKSVRVSQPVYDAAKLAGKLLIDGITANGQLQGDAMQALPLLMQSSAVKADWDADPDAVVDAFLLAAEEDAEALRAALAAKHGTPASTPK